MQLLNAQRMCDGFSSLAARHWLSSGKFYLRFISSSLIESSFSTAPFNIYITSYSSPGDSYPRSLREHSASQALRTSPGRPNLAVAGEGCAADGDLKRTARVRCIALSDRNSRAFCGHLREGWRAFGLDQSEL